MIEADHINMVKFGNRDDDEYKKVLFAFEQLLGQSSVDDSVHRQPLNVGHYTNYGLHVSGGTVHIYDGAYDYVFSIQDLIYPW